MKSLSQDLRLWLLATTLCALVLAGCGAQPPARTAIDQQPGSEVSLTLELEVGKQDVVVGEPVYLTARLRNAGTAPVRIASYLNPKGEAIRVRIQRQGSAPVPFVPMAIDDVNDRGQELAPGAAATVVFPVFYGGRGWSFQEPGTYELVAIYQDLKNRGSKPVESHPVTLRVQQDEASLFLTQGDAGREAGKFLVWQEGDHLRRAQAHLQDLLVRFPSSVLTDAVRLAFGVSLSRNFADYSIDRLRPPQFEEALEYLEKIRTENLPPYLQVQKQLVEARSLIGVNRREEADRALASVRERVTKLPELRRLYESESRREPALPPLQ